MADTASSIHFLGMFASIDYQTRYLCVAIHRVARILQISRMITPLWTFSARRVSSFKSSDYCSRISLDVSTKRHLYP